MAEDLGQQGKAGLSTSFCEQKEAKKLFLISGMGGGNIPQNADGGDDTREADGFHFAPFVFQETHAFAI